VSLKEIKDMRKRIKTLEQKKRRKVVDPGSIVE